jgi:hypothetical protein
VIEHASGEVALLLVEVADAVLVFFELCGIERLREDALEQME